MLSHSSLQIISKSLMFWGWSLATRTFSSLHRYSTVLRFGDWLGHSRTLMCFFLSHSFVYFAVCFRSLSCWNTHPQPIFNTLGGFNALALMLHDPIHRHFDALSVSCPLSRKTPPNLMFPPPYLTVGWCSWGHRQHSSSKHGELSWCQTAGFWSHLTTTLSPSSPLNHWQTLDGPVHVLSWAEGPCGCCMISVHHDVVC